MRTIFSSSLTLLIVCMLGYPVSQATSPAVKNGIRSRNSTDNRQTDLPTPGQYQEKKEHYVLSAHADSRTPAPGNPEVERQVATIARQLAEVDMNNLFSQQITEALKARAKAQLLQPLEQQANEFLSLWGKGQATITVDAQGRFSDSSLSMLFPLWEDKNRLWFAQAGTHKFRSRRIVNWGTGYRFFQPQWMLDGNLFLDQDLSYHNNRLRLGLEHGKIALICTFSEYIDQIK